MGHDREPSPEVGRLRELAEAACGAGDELSPLFAGREVELIDSEHLNPCVRDGILAEAVEIYPVDRRPTQKVT